MNKYSKYVNAIFFLAAGAIFWVSKHYLTVIAGYFQLGRSLGTNIDVYELAVALLLAFLTFFFIKRNSRATDFTSDAVHELLHVTWPSEKEVKMGTIVVIITVIISGLVLGVLDIGLVWFMRQALGA